MMNPPYTLSRERLRERIQKKDMTRPANQMNNATRAAQAASLGGASRGLMEQTRTIGR